MSVRIMQSSSCRYSDSFTAPALPTGIADNIFFVTHSYRFTGISPARESAHFPACGIWYAEFSPPAEYEQ